MIKLSIQLNGFIEPIFQPLAFAQARGKIN